MKKAILNVSLGLFCSTLLSCGTDNEEATPEKTGKLTFSDGIEMVFIEGGTYMQGSDGVINGDEAPQHQVTLSNYYISKYEITQKQYFTIVGHYPELPPVSSEGLGDKYPVYYVAYADAQEFIAKLNVLSSKNYRLPTESEWEFAARGGKKSKGYLYSGSNDPYAVTKYYGIAGNSWEIGFSVPNELGIYDLSGNVYEWTSDWYGSYTSQAQTNPIGPATGQYKVARGGTFINVPVGLRVSARYKYEPTAQEKFLGLRLAHSE
jgi:formylglycine-generating enzyme required for sulfatase activity